MTHSAIIADDITGAGDSGIHFAAAGERTALILDRTALAEAYRDHAAATLSSESRFLSPADAAAAVRQTVRECRDAGARVVYKKIDSTLRGNPGAEIEAILQEGGFDAALVCPAMPKTGRTVRNGSIYLHGAPLDTTETGRDPFNPVDGSAIAAILASQTSLPIGHIGLEAVRGGTEGVRESAAALLRNGSRILVADAETDNDLAVVGSALRSYRAGTEGAPSILPVGAGGLAEAFAGPPTRYAGPEPHGRMLAVIGSLTAVSLAQIECAAASGEFTILDLDMSNALADAESEIDRLVAEACATGKHLLLKNRSLPTGAIRKDDGVRAAALFARAAKALAARTDCGIVYATGGSTAMAVLEALRLQTITLEREIMPGVVLSSLDCPGTRIKWFISKAGGFGDRETIVRLAENVLAPSKA